MKMRKATVYTKARAASRLQAQAKLKHTAHEKNKVKNVTKKMKK